MKNGIKIEVSFFNILINLKKDDLDKINEFVKDFYNCFSSEKSTYWQFEEWAKIKLGIMKKKVEQNINLFPKTKKSENIEFNTDLLTNYSSLLYELLNSNTFIMFFCHTSNIDDRVAFLEFINYIIKNYNKKSHFEKCVRKFQKLDIYDFYYSKNFNFDGIYNISNSQFANSGIYSDGKKKWLSRVDSKFPVLISDANYIIEYNKNNNFICLKLKNLQFDLETLPSKSDLCDKMICNPEVDYDTSNMKTAAVDLLYQLNECSNNIDDLIPLSKNLSKMLKNTKSKDVVKKISNRLSILNSVKSDLEELKLFLLKEYDKQNIIKKDERESSLERKEEYIKLKGNN